METWHKLLALTIGGSLGVNARYWLGAWITHRTGPRFPWGTVTINVSGSFLIGFLTVYLARWLPHPNMRLLVITGFLGGYTTFSTFESDTLTLWERGESPLALANLVGSVTAGFAAVVLGTTLARGFTEPLSHQAMPRATEAESKSAHQNISPPYIGSEVNAVGGDRLDTHLGPDNTR